MNKEKDTVVQILEETAKKFRSLYIEARSVLAEKDVDGWETKLKERGRLLIDLPNSLAPVLENMEPELKTKILYKISSFADIAEKALSENNTFGLSAILTKMGQKENENNDLEKLIKDIKQKI